MLRTGDFNYLVPYSSHPSGHLVAVCALCGTVVSQLAIQRAFVSDALDCTSFVLSRRSLRAVWHILVTACNSRTIRLRCLRRHVSHLTQRLVSQLMPAYGIPKGVMKKCIRRLGLLGNSLNLPAAWWIVDGVGNTCRYRIRRVKFHATEGHRKGG